MRLISNLILLSLIAIFSCSKSTIRSATVTYYANCNLQTNQKLVITYNRSNSLPITDTLSNGSYSVTVSYMSGNEPTMNEPLDAYILTGNVTRSIAGINLKTVSNGVTNANFTTNCCFASINFSF